MCLLKAMENKQPNWVLTLLLVNAMNDSAISMRILLE